MHIVSILLIITFWCINELNISSFLHIDKLKGRLNHTSDNRMLTLLLILQNTDELPISDERKVFLVWETVTIPAYLCS